MALLLLLIVLMTYYFFFQSRVAVEGGSAEGPYQSQCMELDIGGGNSTLLPEGSGDEGKEDGEGHGADSADDSMNMGPGDPHASRRGHRMVYSPAVLVTACGRSHVGPCWPFSSSFLSFFLSLFSPIFFFFSLSLSLSFSFCLSLSLFISLCHHLFYPFSLFLSLFASNL